MSKGFFYFSRSQRIGILIVLALIIIALAVMVAMPYFFKSEEIVADEEFLQEVEEFKASLVEKERIWRTDEDFYPFVYRNYPRNNYASTKYELFHFDPNTADSITFLRLGLKPFITKNILRYRAKGGKFKTPENFAKVYGITPEKFNELLPYIQITGANQSIVADDLQSDYAETLEESPTTLAEVKKDIFVELNSADTVLLKRIKGIGSVLGRRIVSYRAVLGGYYAVEQLKEVYGMSPENYERISAFVNVNQEQISKININKASIEKMKAHPYIKTFQRAKAIYEYRRKKIRLENISQLKHLEEFSTDDWRRLEPYLMFE